MGIVRGCVGRSVWREGGHGVSVDWSPIDAPPPVTEIQVSMFACARSSHGHGDPVNVESDRGLLMGNCFIN